MTGDLQPRSFGGEMLFKITAPHFCAGVAVAHDGAIVAAAPILAWAYNRPWAYLRRWAEGKGYKVEACKGESALLL